jgi:hypothetical protein
MDYKLTGEFTPGKFGEWRFDKRTYGSRPPPRHLGEPPKNMKNDLVGCHASCKGNISSCLPAAWCLSGDHRTPRSGAGGGGAESCAVGAASCARAAPLHSAADRTCPGVCRVVLCRQVRALINSINEGSAALPCWDKYAETGKVSYDCDEMKTLADPRFKKDGKAIV